MRLLTEGRQRLRVATRRCAVRVDMFGVNLYCALLRFASLCCAVIVCVRVLCVGVPIPFQIVVMVRALVRALKASADDDE